MVDDTREYTSPSWPEIIRHLMRASEWDELRNKQLAQFHSSQTAALLHHLAEGTTTRKSPGIEQSLKKMLWEDQVTLIQDPFIIAIDPKSSQATLSLRLNLKWIKILESIAEDTDEAEQVLLRLQHLRSTGLSDIPPLPPEDTALHAVLSKKELNQSFFDNLLNLLGTSGSNALIANLLSSQNDMHSLAFIVLNNKDLWLHDPFKGTFLCQDKEKLKDFFIKFCHENYPAHQEASIVQPGTKLKQDLSTKPSSSSELPSENASRKNFLFSAHTQDKAKKSSEEKEKPEHKPRSPGGGTFKK